MRPTPSTPIRSPCGILTPHQPSLLTSAVATRAACLEIVQVGSKAASTELGAQDASAAKDRHKFVKDPVHRHRVEVAPQQDPIIVRRFAKLLDEVGEFGSGTHKPASITDAPEPRLRPEKRPQRRGFHIE
jgi:hypothetical protein